MLHLESLALEKWISLLASRKTYELLLHDKGHAQAFVHASKHVEVAFLEHDHGIYKEPNMSCYVIESCLAKLARLACPKALAVD
jgi:hypothetical protein